MTTTIIQYTGVLDCFFGLQPTMKPPSAIHLSSASNLQNKNYHRYTIQYTISTFRHVHYLQQN